MKAITYSYRNGTEVIQSQLSEEIISALASSDYRIEPYTIGKLREEFILEIKKKGWSDVVQLDSVSKISITSEKQGIGLCLQTGNVSRVYADLLKLQNLYVQGRIKAGIIIVPTAICAKQYTSNSATYERLVRELDIFSQVITMPVLVVGFYN